jgi:hypothetical protein
MDLQATLAALTTASVQNGVIAQLTRQAYINPFVNEINYSQFLPIVYFNIIEQTISISNTTTINFTPSDIFSATDWILLNATL